MSIKNDPDSSETTNPLLMDPVLQILFNLLDVPDLKNCRFVTTEWATKAFQTLKSRTVIKLDTIAEIKKYFKPSEELGGSAPSDRFIGFGFEVEAWDEVLSQHIQTHGTRDLSVNYTLVVTSRSSFDSFQDLLSRHCKKLVKLDVTVLKYIEEVGLEDVEREGPMPNFSLPLHNALKETKYPFLNSLTIRHDKDDFGGLELNRAMTCVWISMIKNSANLKHLGLSIEDVGFWSDLSIVPVLKILETLESLSVAFISSEITQIIGRMAKLNLKQLELKFIPGGVDPILQRVAHSLETLKFLTPNESALSPVNFPVMPKLRILNSGNSQLSFPSITLRQLPALEEVQVTYWDWVWTFEELPDGHYYWRTDEPHPKVTRLSIRFPPIVDVTGNYLVMENFVDFCSRISGKFPLLQAVRLKNMCNNPAFSPLPGTNKLRDIVRSMGTRLKEISIVDYYQQTESNSLDLMNSVDAETCLELEILDLNPTEWLKIWKGEERGQVDFFLWNLNRSPIPNLRVAKLLWVVGLQLAVFVNNSPGLVHLEVIGNRCIDRFDRHKMRKLRPDLIFIQHPCICSKEDVWYMSDPHSQEVFHRLFTVEFEDKQSSKTEAFLHFRIC